MVRPRGYLSELFTSVQGEGPHAGKVQTFLRTAACHFRCAYCDTPSALVQTATFRVETAPGTRHFDERSNPVGAEETVRLLERCSQGVASPSLAVTGGEPLLQVEYLEEVLDRLHGGFSPVLLETSGMLPEPLRRLLGRVDLVSTDVKLPSAVGQQVDWAAMEASLALCREKPMYTKLVVTEGTSEKDLDRAAELIDRAAPQVPVILQPVTASEEQRPPSLKVLLSWHSRLARALKDVRILPQLHPLASWP